MRQHSILMILVLLNASPVMASDWSEIGEAGGFPGQSPQITSAEDELDTISGALTLTTDDRDSYCIDVVEAGVFQATTDPASETGATADFNTRLFLFNPWGDPVLANDDTAPSGSPFLSTLTGTANDESGFVLAEGQYILTIAGSSDEPQDDTTTGLFDFGAGLDLVHASNPAAGLYDAWTTTPAAVGSYTIALNGAAHCQPPNEIVLANSTVTTAEKNTYCSVATGGTDCRDVDETAFTSYGVDLGDLDGNGTLDAVFANGSTPSGQSVCLFDGSNFACSTIDEDSNGFVGDVNLGLINSDAHLDAVFSVASGDKINVLCLGNGSGGFTSCAPFGPAGSDQRVALGRFDDNATLDAIFARNNEPNLVCLNDGEGGFTCSDVSETATGTRDVAVGYLNNDIYMDAIFVGFATTAELCLGSASGNFSCASVTGTANSGFGVSLGDLDADGNLDAVLATYQNMTQIVCMGDGSGGLSCSTFELNRLLDRPSVAVGFIDQDIFPDAVYANDDGGGDPGEISVLCRGDGAGGFTCADLYPEAHDSAGVAIGDFGILDFQTILADGFESPAK